MGNNIEIALPVGTELGDYRILRTLGQGGFGITYLAEVISSGERVVIKENLPTFCAWRDRSTLQVSATTPNDELQEYAKLLTRFVEEAQLLARLDHPNIVKVVGAFKALGTAYYVMPWLDSKELHKAAPAPATITEVWLRPLLCTLLGALQYLHSNNIYHRDVKPANILLTEEGTPVLIDFGTARAIISERSATLVGSPGYSPVEQLRAHGKRGPWTDIYSLGATCYRLITGKNPPEAFDRMDEDEDPLRPLANQAELFGRFSPAFLATIDKALAIRGKDRWQSTDEWLTALSAAMPIAKTTAAKVIYTTPINTSTVSAPPEPPSSKQIIAPRKRVHKALNTGAIIALVLALAIPGGFLLYQQAQETDRLAWEEAERKAKEDVQNRLKKQGLTESEYPYGIHYAAAENNAKELAKLIASGADINAVDSIGWTPLLWAASKGHTACVQLLLNTNGINVNQANKDGETPLLWATWRGHTECVQLLLFAPGIKVDMADKQGWTPLKTAKVNHHEKCVRLLRQAGSKK